MREGGHGLRLALEARIRLRVESQILRQDLDRDLAIERRVAGAVNLPHPSRAERPEDLVVTEVRAGGEGHGDYFTPSRM